METDDLRTARAGAGRNVVIVPFGPSHVREVARMHTESLTGLLSALGQPAARAYYQGAARAPETRAFVAYDGEHVVGFVMGSARPEKLRRRIARENRAAILAGLFRGIALRPHLLKWLLRTRKGPDEGSYDSRAPELIYLAVASRMRGSGTGRALVDAFTAAMKRDGAGSYELSVDDSNVSAVGFYEKLGFHVTGRYREFGIWHRRYRFDSSGAHQQSEPQRG